MSTPTHFRSDNKRQSEADRPSPIARQPILGRDIGSPHRYAATSYVSRLCLITCLLSGSLVAIPVSAMQDRAAAKTLLTDVWENSSDSRAEAERILIKAQRQEPRSETAFAAGLVLINHKKYNDAIEWMSVSLVADETNVAARRANVWLLARTRQNNRALDQLSLLLEQLKRSEELQPREREELIRFVGRMMGFFEGPAKESTSAAAIDRANRDVAEKLAEEEQAWFDEARNVVIEKFDAFIADKEVEDDRALEDAEIEQEKLIEELEKRIGELTEQADAIFPSLNRVRDEASKELESIRSEDTPLARQQTSLESRAIALDSELAAISRDIARLELRASREKDRYYRDSYLREADRLRFTARRIDADLIAVNREIAIVVSDRRRLQNEFSRTEAIYNRQISDLTGQLEAVQKEIRRADLQLARTRSGPNVDQRRSRGMNAQLKAITTYEEFPLEQQRRRILAELE